MCKIPLIQVAAELYLLVYELGPVTMVQLAAYQAASLGVVDPAMHDTIFAKYLQIVARDTVGMEALDIAYRRMFPFKMAGLLPPYRPRKKNIALKESKQKPNGRRSRGYCMYGPNKGKPFSGPED